MATSQMKRFVSVLALLVLPIAVQAQTVTPQDLIARILADVTALKALLPPSVPTVITDRLVRPKPAPRALGPAGSSWIEPTFGTKMWRVTDQATNGGSGVFPASVIGGAWNADGTKFVLMGAGGNAIFYGFDGKTITPLSITIRNQAEPWFSYVDPNLIYANVFNPSTGSYRLIKTFNLATGGEVVVADLDALYVDKGLTPGGYIGPLAVVDHDVFAVLFGGYNQDSHFLVHHSVLGLIDYRTLTVQSAAGPVKGGTLHGIGLDRLGRLLLNPSAADIAAHPGIAQIQVYDPVTKTLTPLTDAMKGGGHYQTGYGQMVNQDCCTRSTWDAAQWQLRSLDHLAATTDLITEILTPKVIGLDDHTDWRNAQPGKQLPILSVTIRKDLPLLSGGPWRAWDDEVIFIHTDGNGIVERLAHTQAIYDPANYRSQPEGHLDPTGRYVLFASNWGSTIGAGRQDVFLVARP